MTLGRAHINRLRDFDTTESLIGRLFDELGNEVSYLGYTSQPVILEPWPSDIDKSGNLTVTTQFAAPPTQVSFKYLQILDVSTGGERHYIEVSPDGVTVPVGQPIVIAVNGIEIDYSGEITSQAEGVKFTMHHELARPPHTFEVGNPVAYTLIAVNHGDAADTNVNVRMTYPNAILDFVNASISPSFPITPGTLDFSFASIEGNGAAGYVSVEFTALIAGTALTTFQFIGSDSGASAASATQTITIGDAIAGQLSIQTRWSGVSPSLVYENDKRTIEMVVREIGNKAVTDATVQLQISGLGTLSNPQGHGGSATVQPLIVELTGLTFAANEEKTITVDCEMDDLGAVTATGRVTNWHNSGAQAFPIESNMNFSILNGLSLVLLNTGGTWSVNDNVPFQMEVKNLSNQELETVQALVALPAEFQYQVGSGVKAPAAYDGAPGGNARWDWSLILPNTTENVIFNLTAVAAGTNVVTFATGNGFQSGGVKAMAQFQTSNTIQLGGVGTLSIELSMVDAESGPIVNNVDLELDGLLMMEVKITELANDNITGADFFAALPLTNFQMLVANPETPEYSVQSAKSGFWDELEAKIYWENESFSPLEVKKYYFLLQAITTGSPAITGTIDDWDNKSVADPTDSFAINVVLTTLEGSWIY